MAKKKASSGSSKSFNLKEFMLLHLEKILFAVIACLSFGLIGMGFSAKPYPSQKTPEVLGKDATQASVKLKENHWDEYSKALPPVKKDFPKAVEQGRKKIAANPIYIYPPSEVSSSRRGDPKLLAPTNLVASYYYGPLALAIPTDKVKKEDKVFNLDDAKKPEERVRPNRTGGNRGMGSGGAGGEEGKGSGGMGMGSGGMGLGSGGVGPGGAGPGAANQGPRFLAPGYDRGFQMGMRTDSEAVANATPTDVRKVAVSGTKGFVAVTALAPHAELEKIYKAELQEAPGYLEGRDTPNYVGIEVQRVEIVAENANRELEESDWKPLPKARTEEYRKIVKSLIGTCQEVQNTEWTEPNISMPIPPVLLNDFRKFSSHPEIPLSTVEPDEESTESDDESNLAGSGGSSSGMMGSGGPGMGMGGAGMGMGSAGMGMGSGGMGRGGAGMGMGGAGMGMGMGSGGMVGGGDEDSEGSGMGMGPGGRGMGSGGMGMGMPGMSGQVTAELPKKLPSTKYKLVRFFDFDALPGKTYRYRVRLLMYDPNFPSVKLAQPKSNTLKPATLARVQELIANESKKPEGNGNAEAAGRKTTATAGRVSKRESDWSAASQPVSVVRPELFFASEKTDCVVGEYDPTLSVYVPHASPAEKGVERGMVFGTVRRERGKEVPFEIISPAGKSIKAYKDFKPKSMVTIVNITGQSALKVATAKDPIKTGSELVGFDPSSGQLLVAREFDDFTSYNMHFAPDSPAVGPLGGGLKSEFGGGGGTGPGMGQGSGFGMGAGSGGGGMSSE